MTSREQEIKALENIKATISNLGKDSYVATAFDGCVEIAEENIENDFWCSMKGQKESLMQSVEKLTAEINALKSKNAQLEKQLDRELEWKPYIDERNVSQESYDELVSDPLTSFLSDEEAKDLIYEWFGFAREKVRIIYEINIYEINRHRRLRKVGTKERKPAYNATDWNYILFECGGVKYEIYNVDTYKIHTAM